MDNQFYQFKELYSTGKYVIEFTNNHGNFILSLRKYKSIPLLGKFSYGKPVKSITISLGQLSFAQSLYLSSTKANEHFGRENKLNYAEYKAYVMHGFMEGATNSPMDLMHACVGMAGELGEVIEHIKKHVFHKKPLDAIKLTEELGDFQWYHGAFLGLMDITIVDILVANKAKLDERYKNGRQDLTFRDTKIEYELMDKALNGDKHGSNKK